jgi:hypothetical protein
MGVGEFAVCDFIVTASSLRVKNLCCMVSADLFRTGLGTCVSPFRPREEICYLAVWKGKFVLREPRQRLGYQTRWSTRYLAIPGNHVM